MHPMLHQRLVYLKYVRKNLNRLSLSLNYARVGVVLRGPANWPPPTSVPTVCGFDRCRDIIRELLNVFVGGAA